MSFYADKIAISALFSIQRLDQLPTWEGCITNKTDDVVKQIRHTKETEHSDVHTTATNIENIRPNVDLTAAPNPHAPSS